MEQLTKMSKTGLCFECLSVRSSVLCNIKLICKCFWVKPRTHRAFATFNRKLKAQSNTKTAYSDAVRLMERSTCLKLKFKKHFYIGLAKLLNLHFLLYLKQIWVWQICIKIFWFRSSTEKHKLRYVYKVCKLFTRNGNILYASFFFLKSKTCKFTTLVFSYCRTIQMLCMSNSAAE